MSKHLENASTGWSNYETWCVSQWLPTDEATWEAFRENVRRLVAKHKSEPGEYGPITCSQRRIVKSRLAGELRRLVEQLGYTDLPGIYCDLLDSALARVNWPEIVDYFLRYPFRSSQDGTLRPLFEVGLVFTAPAAQAALTPDDVQTALDRHSRGDWSARHHRPPPEPASNVYGQTGPVHLRIADWQEVLGHYHRGSLTDQRPFG